MTKQQKHRGFAPILAIILALIIIGGGVYLYKNNQKKVEGPVATSQVPENYISIIDSTSRQARFKFSVPVQATDFSGQNVGVCVVGHNAASPQQTNCTLATNDKFQLSYDSATQVLTIKDIQNYYGYWQDHGGAFRTSCASCTHEVKFSHLKTIDGVALPTKMIFVY